MHSKNGTPKASTPTTTHSPSDDYINRQQLTRARQRLNLYHENQKENCTDVTLDNSVPPDTPPRKSGTKTLISENGSYYAQAMKGFSGPLDPTNLDDQ